MNILNGVRVIESWWLTEKGEPVARWFPCGGGWKVKRMIVPDVPYRGAITLADGTLVMHPVTLREMQLADPR